MASGGDDKRVLCWQLDRAVHPIPGYQPAVEQYGKKQPVKRCSQNSMKEHYELREKESSCLLQVHRSKILQFTWLIATLR